MPELVAATTDARNSLHRQVEKLITAIGEREQAPAVLAAATRLRQKAFTLALNTYGELRRGVIYLRYREGDADQIAPSLYGGRTRRRGEEDEAPAAPPSAGAAPVSPTTAPFGSSFSSPADAIAGLPDESPFLPE